MDLTPYVEALHRQLMVAAEAGGEDAQRLAERLVAPLDAATRLVLLDVLSDATSEITRDLAPGSVEVRLRGRHPDFVVTSPPPDDAFEDVATTVVDPPSSAATAPLAEGDEDGGTSRITLRLPEQLKARVEAAAARDGLSVNSWLVRAASDAVDPTDRRRGPARRSASGGERFVGWAR
jgi:HicB family